MTAWEFAFWLIGVCSGWSARMVWVHLGREAVSGRTEAPAHPRECYPCKGTGRVIGFGADGAPCPADHETEG